MTIHTAGVKNLMLPVKVMQKDGNIQNTIADISLQTQIPTALEPNYIASITAIINRYIDRIAVSEFQELLSEVRNFFNAESTQIDMSFPYFLEKKAPVTETSAMMEYRCIFSGTVGTNNGFFTNRRRTGDDTLSMFQRNQRSRCSQSTC